MAGGLSPDATPRQVRDLLAAQPVDGWTLRDLNIGIAVLQRHGAQDESLVLHAELAARRPDPAIRARYGRTLRQAGRRAEAERIFRGLIADGAADQAVFEDLRGLLLSAGDAEGALQIARAEQDRFGASENLLMFLTALPGSDGAALARQLMDGAQPSRKALAFAARFFAERQDHAAAIQAAERLARDYPDGSHSRALAHYMVLAGRRPDAVAVLEALAKSHPADFETLRRLAGLKAEAGDVAGALDCAMTATQLRPRDADIWHQAGVLAERTGDIVQSILCLRQAHDLRPGSLQTAIALADTLAGQGRLQDSLAVLDAATAHGAVSGAILERRDAIARDLAQNMPAPDAVAAHAFSPGMPARTPGPRRPAIRPQLRPDQLRTLLQTHDPAELEDAELQKAVEIFERHDCIDEALALLANRAARAPLDVHLAHLQARCLQRAGQHEGAQQALETLIAEAPDFRPAYADLRILWQAQNRHAEARALAQRELEACGATENLLLNLANLALQAGDRAEAIAAVRRLVEGENLSRETLNFAVKFFIRNQINADAAHTARKLARLHPGPGARMGLARNLSTIRRFGEAVEILSELVAEEQENAEAWRLLSEALAENGQANEGLRCALKAVELAPRNSNYWYHLGMLYARTGRGDEAVAALNRALQISPRATNIAIAHANLLAEQGRMREAIAILDQTEGLIGFNRDVQGARLALLANELGRGEALPLPAAAIRPLPRAKMSREKETAFLGSVLIQIRVVLALMIRDIHHRTASSRFGLFSALAEPVMQIVMLGVVLSIFNRGQPPLGTSLFFFYATGVIPFYLFLHIVNATMNLYKENMVLLRVPRIKRVDLVLAHALGEFMVGGMTAVILFSLFFLFGKGEGTDNILQAILAYASVGLFSLGVGLIGCCIQSFTELWQRVWQTGQRAMYFMSGIFFIPTMMPDWARDILVWNPMLVGIEWFRSGFFQQYSPPWIDGRYVVVMSLVLITLGLTLERATRRRVKPGIS